jgi:hypothetical protein
MGHGWGLRTSDISELETQMQEIQKHNQNRITTVEAEVTASRCCFVTDADRLLESSTHDRTNRANPPSIRSSNGTGKALLKEQGQ